MNHKKFRFWKKIKKLCENKMRKAWLEGGNCDSACKNCNQWESSGNVIYTKSNDDGSESRECQNCRHEWRAIFTPAGFVEVD